jgi:hypothetical protein
MKEAVIRLVEKKSPKTRNFGLQCQLTQTNSPLLIITTSKKCLYINSYGSYNSISEISSKEPLNNITINQQVNGFNSNNEQGNKRLKRKIDRENTVNKISLFFKPQMFFTFQ